MQKNDIKLQKEFEAWKKEEEYRKKELKEWKEQEKIENEVYKQAKEYGKVLFETLYKTTSKYKFPKNYDNHLKSCFILAIEDYFIYELNVDKLFRPKKKAKKNAITK